MGQIEGRHRAGRQGVVLSVRRLHALQQWPHDGGRTPAALKLIVLLVRKVGGDLEKCCGEKEPSLCVPDGECLIDGFQQAQQKRNMA